MNSTDVIVIGSGVIGCTCAWRLAQAGVRVRVVERGQVGREASWAGAGIIERGSLVREDALAQWRRASVAAYPALVAELHQLTGIDPELIRCPRLDLISDAAQEAAALREAEAAAMVQMPGEPPLAERVDLRTAREIEPLLDGDFEGALLVRDAMQVRNPRLLAALHRACELTGVRFETEAEVDELLLRQGAVRGVRCKRGTFEADRVVLAAGAWSSELHPLIESSMPVHPVRGQMLLLKPEPRLRAIVYLGRRYFVGRSDGHLLVGSTEERVGFDKRNTLRGLRWLFDGVARVLPSLESACVVQQWAGLRPGSADGRPYVGPVPALDGLIAATGHFRSGLTLAPVTADAVVRYCVKGAIEPPAGAFAPGREACDFLIND